MSNITTLPQMQTAIARIAAFIAEALNTVAEAINEIEPTIENATTEKAGLMSTTDKIKLDNINLSHYVTTETGKGLSTNDFTAAYKTKLDGIATGAQVNVIETVKVNGTALPVTNKSVDITVGSSSIVTLDTTSQTTEGALWLEWS